MEDNCEVRGDEESDVAVGIAHIDDGREKSDRTRIW